MRFRIARATPSSRHNVACSGSSQRTSWFLIVSRGEPLSAEEHAAGHLVPAHDTIVGDIAPINAARIAEIDRPLGPAHAGGQPFNAGEQEPIFVEARIAPLWAGLISCTGKEW